LLKEKGECVAWSLVIAQYYVVSIFVGIGKSPSPFGEKLKNKEKLVKRRGIQGEDICLNLNPCPLLL